MMRQWQLVERVQKYAPDADEVLLNKAYVYAMKAHGNQKRASGDPYFSHPLEVAAILTDLKLDDATIAAALLHDTIEDTGTTREEIEGQFGPEIGALVDGLSKIKKLDLVTKQAEQAENFRKLLLAISSDIRVLLVKLADRLHNMRTLEHMKPEKRKRIAEETLEIYAPLAGRMGMQWLRDELEDLSFRWLNPEAYKAVTARLTQLREKNRGLIDQIIPALQERLTQRGIQAEVTGREKKPHSIWRKMERKQISLEQLSDIYAFRVVVATVEDCYRVVGVAHTTWHIVPGRFKDYISNSKPNGYQSLHTTIIGPGHQRVELQIRTPGMHDIAEYGVAAHALYKDRVQNNGADAGERPSTDTNAYEWLRRLVETLLQGDNAEEFLEHAKLELFQDQVFCFTPKGRLIALPRGAVPIDFAYAVHTDVGNHCVGCRINGRPASLITELRNGDEVQIETSSTQTPPAAWEKLARTGKARSAIRRAAKEALRHQYAGLGRDTLSKAFAALGREFSDELLTRGLSRLTQKSTDEVFAAVGRGELAADTVVKAVFPLVELPKRDAPKRIRRNRLEGRSETRSEEGWFNLTNFMGLKFRIFGADSTGPNEVGQALPIRGLRRDLPVNFGEGALPGDRIVGIMTPGQGIAIYPIHSPKLKAFDNEPERWIDVTWDIPDDSNERFPAAIEVTVLNQPGVLARVAQIIGEADGNIDNLRMVSRGADFTKMHIDLEVWDLTHLNEIIAGLRQEQVVQDVTRVFSAAGG